MTVGYLYSFCLTFNSHCFRFDIVYIDIDNKWKILYQMYTLSIVNIHSCLLKQ